jgi:transcriptional regulator with PAS, ATPase and Fis domain
VSATIFVSTHDLKRAGALRNAFRAQHQQVELVTPDEELPASDGEVLLVLSSDAGTPATAKLLEQARRRGIPVVGYGAPGTEQGRGQDLLEVFGPHVSPEEAALLGVRLLDRKRLQQLTGIVGETDAIREALERVVQIAPVDSTVLITGESGTGKELVARGIHALSPRRHKPFIAVNVAALPDTLLESELFGHEKGAFTGAIDARKGLFELAHSGTILLDEIGEMPLATQTKLLRVLEQREFLRVGGEKSVRVDVRIIAATNQDLRQLVTIGEFRKDLYYRLNVLSIVLPPLRERPEDIPLLVDAFVREVSAHLDRRFRGVSPEAIQILQSYQWPGNVRELKNLVESMVVLAPGREIRASDIPPEVRRVDRQHALVPAELSRADRNPSAQQLRPELEFIFRTLVEMRVDMDQLRREFEEYRMHVRSPELLGRVERRFPAWQDAEFGEVAGAEPAQSAEVVDVGERHPGNGALAADPGAADGPAGATPEDQSVVVYRSGMSMEDMEREAIRAALREVGGNRRKAAERLGIGERTLYRKIQRFGLER